MNHWHLAIGDPTPAGWLTTFIYGSGAITCFVAARRATISAQSSFWLILAGILVALGFNKQLDFQSLFTEEGRRVAIAQGWFNARRLVQIGFVLISTAAVLAAGVLLSRHRLSSNRPIRLAMIGLAALAAFILLRAAFFYHVSLPGNVAEFARSGAEYLEIAGVVLVSGAAALFRGER